MKSANEKRYISGRTLILTVMITMLCMFMSLTNVFADIEGSESTEQSIHSTFELEADLVRDNGLQVKISAKLLNDDYKGDAYVVLQLMDHNTPLLINAIPLDQEAMDISQRFDVEGANYRVKVFILDSFNSEIDVPVYLASTVTLL